jgi:putative molybdopterin biosynthesis protein
MLAAPLTRGSGVITSLVRADGIALIPRGSQGLEAGSVIPVRLYRSKPELEISIFAIGSHDMTLDILSQFLVSHQRRLISANVGSLAGLVALKRGEAHITGSHLLDPQTGIYNVAYIERYLDGIPTKVIDLVGREQGLMIKKGNPKAIRQLMDLAQPGVQFVNRQRGAGTRVLLDYQLDKLKIDAQKISGYEHEEFTHLAVAAAVASGRADCGLGITAAAHALDLDFIPLFYEKYQLVIPERFFKDTLLSPLFEVIEDPEFRQEVSKLPGYDISSMGKFVAEFNRR